MESIFKGKKVLITGGRGFLGRYLVSMIKDLMPEEIIVVGRKECDLREQREVRDFLKKTKPDLVIHAAVTGGGIGFMRKNPAPAFYDNIMMGTILMEEARKLGCVEKYCSIGTICAYPKFTPVPFKEEDLWNGYPEETNAPYGLAKKMHIVQAQAYFEQYGFLAINPLLVNLYGPHDNFDPENSHVIPALIRKFVDAVKHDKKEVVVWGTGQASREFLYVEDAAEGIILAMEKLDTPEPVNIGAGFEIKIADLVSKIANITGFKGKIVWDTSKPDGQPRRMLDTSKALKLFGFKAKTSFEEGLKKTYEWYLKNLA